MGTGSGSTPYISVRFKKPLEFNVDNLPPILILEMVVPREYCETLNVLGSDVLFKHKIIISSSNMKVDIKFLPSEQNNYSTNTLNEYKETFFSGLKGNFDRFVFSS